MLNFKQFANQQLKEQSELEDSLSENILSGLFKLGTKLATKKATKEASKVAKEVAPSARDRAIEALQRSNFGKDTKTSSGYDVLAAGAKLKQKLRDPSTSGAAEPKSIAGDMLNKYKSKGTPKAATTLKASTQNVSPGQALKPGKRMSSTPTPTGSIPGKGSVVGNMARGAGKIALGLTPFAPDEMASGELSPEMKQIRDIENTQPSNDRVGKGHPGEKTIYKHAANVSMPKTDVTLDQRAERKLVMPRDNSLPAVRRRMDSEYRARKKLGLPRDNSWEDEIRSMFNIPPSSLELPTELSPEEAAKRDAKWQKLSDAAKAQKRMDATSGSELMVNPTTGVVKPIAVQSKLTNAEYDRSAAERQNWISTQRDIHDMRARRLSKKQEDDKVKAQRESTPQVPVQVQPKSSREADRKRREAEDAELRTTLKKYGVTLEKK